MKGSKVFVIFVAVVLVALSENLLAEQYGAVKPSSEEVVQKTQKLHMPFIANDGQVDEEVAFYAKTFGGTVFVTKDGEIVYSLPRYEDAAEEGRKKIKTTEKPEDTEDLSFAVNAKIPHVGRRGSSPLTCSTVDLVKRSETQQIDTSVIARNKVTKQSPHENPKATGVALKEQLVGGKIFEIKGEGEAVTKVSYFKGNDPAKWKSNISTYDMVNLGEVYDGIELKLKAHGNNVEKLFYVKPGADPGQIKVSLSGIQPAVCKQKQPPESPFFKGNFLSPADGSRGWITPLINPSLFSNTAGFVKGDDYKIPLNKGGAGVVFPGNENGHNQYNFPIEKQNIANSPLENGSTTMSPLDFVVSAQSNEKGARGLYASDGGVAPTVRLSAHDEAFMVGQGQGDGAGGLWVNEEGQLVAETALGPVKFTKPVAYQVIEGKRVEVPVGYIIQHTEQKAPQSITPEISTSNPQLHNSTTPQLHNSTTPQLHNSTTPQLTYGFTVAAYDKTKDLIIDPLLASTFLGGNDFDRSYDITLDTSGNVYVTGSTVSANFPTTSRAYDTSFNGGSDVFVSKLNGGLTSLLASTSLGGSDGDGGSSLTLDTSGNVYVTGGTESTDFPTTGGAYDTSFNVGGQDVFISKLNSGLTSLLASTYLGGSDQEYGKSLALDMSGNVYVTGLTYSTNFQTTSGAYATSYNGGGDVFVSKLNGGLTSLLASTFLGGADGDWHSSLTLDTSGNVYVTGGTMSTDFPTTSGAYDTSYYGSYNDVFVSKLNSGLTNLLASTYLGGYSDEYGSSLVLDTGGNVYVTGQTYSQDFPMTSGAYDISSNGDYDVFVSKLNSELTVLLASTYMGGSRIEYGDSLTLDMSGNIYVTGWTGSTNFPTTSGAYATSYGGSGGVFVSKLNSGLTSLLVSTNLGTPDGEDEDNSLTLDTSGNVYVMGGTFSTNFPTTSGAYATSYNGGGDVFVSKLDSNLSTNPPSTNYGINTNAGYVAEPVNTALGNYTYQHTDLTMPGRSIGLQFERSYNSQDSYNGPLGYGWTHTYNIALTENTNNGSVVVKWGDGHDAFYHSNNNGAYTPLYGGVFDALIKNNDGTFTLTQKDQTQYTFDTAGRFTSITDKNNNSIVLTHDASNNLTKMSDTTTGRYITLAYDTNNHISMITDSIGRTVKYTYDNGGNLASVTDANGGITQCTYDDSHRVLTITNPRGDILVSNTYDIQGRVISQDNGKGFTTTFNYDTPNAGDTTVTDPLGFATIYTHDNVYRLTQLKDANGNTINYTYDNNNNRTSVTDKNGKVTSYTYDSMGNVTSKTDPFSNATTIVYDARNNPTKKTDALGSITSYKYDNNGNLTSTTDPLGNISSITYNSYGQPLTLTDANGNVTTHEYDAQGNVLAVTDALTHKTTYTYDDVGRRISATDANGNTTSFTYDKHDNLLMATDPLGGVTSYVYDANNNRTSITDPNKNITSYSYDENDLLTTVKDALNNVITYTYDKADNKISAQDALGNTTSYAYDGVKNLAQIKDALNNITTYTYDANGNKLTEINPLGQTVTYAYDALNRVVSVTDPLSNTTTNTYDALGRVTENTNSKGQVTHFEYDAMGRLTKVTDAKGGVVLYAYDKNGNRISMTEPKGNITSYTYDAVNRLVKKVEPLGKTHQYAYDAVGNRITVIDAKGRKIQYAYDGNRRLVKVTYPNHAKVTFTYDANGNKTKMVDALGKTTYTYNGLNRMVSCNDSFGKKVVYGYDANGNRTSIKYPDGKVVTYAYDVLNRLKTVTDWLGHTTSYTYDAAGNLTGISNPNKTTVAYTYDDAGRLTAIENAKSDATVISGYTYTLDALGNHTKVVQDEPLTPLFAYQNVTYTYDAENRLTKVNGMANKYDANGNLIKRGSDTFTYDYEDRLIQSNIDGALAEYRYDGIGNRLEKTDEETTTRYVLDTNGSLSNVLAETDDSGDITAYYVYGLGLLSKILPDGTTYYYHYDSRGSAVALTDADENITDAYAYDSFGRLANSTGTTTNPFKYVGRYGVMDEGNGILYIRARYYMPETGRFIAKDPIAGNDRDGQGLNRYVYAVNNPVRLVDISGYSALEGNVSQDNSGSSDTLHSWLIDRERRKKEYRAQAMMAWNDYVAALETEAAYWEAWINTLEAIHGALDAVRGLYIQGPKGVGGGIGEMVSVLTRTLGYQKTSETIDVGLNAYRVYEMFDAIRGLPEQIQSTKTVFNAIHNVGIGGVNWENVLKTDAASNVGNLYKDVILLPDTLWGLISN